MLDIDAGYSVTEGLFERAGMVRILAALDEAEIKRTKAGARHVSGPR